MKLAAWILLAAPVALLGQGTYTIDPAHSSAQFSVKHLMVSNVKGTFSGVKGSVTFDPNNLPGSKVEATIDVTTISTQEPKRDAHLKSPDFFEVEKYPTMAFVSKQFFREGNRLKVKGDLTMHGQTKEVVFDVDGPTQEVKTPMGVRVGATVSGTINRKDWGLNWNRAIETGGVVVGDEVKITIEVEATKKS